MGAKTSGLFFSFIFLFLASSCVKHSERKVRPVKGYGGPTEIPIAPKVSRGDYLSGKEFCEYYKKITVNENGRPVKKPLIEGEFGKWVKVPKNYSNRDEGFTEIYAWTLRPFDPASPSVVNIDGGPGQNSHGLQNAVPKPWNEIFIDQRGLGCSAFESYDDYINPRNYSSMNNVMDMEEVRKAYGIPRWALYGVSYGTVPATMYASQFSLATVSLVLEGVVFDYQDLHVGEWKAEKLNWILDQLSESQQKGFSKILDNDHYGPILGRAISATAFAGRGYQQFLDLLKETIRDEENIDWQRLDETEKKLQGQMIEGLSQKPLAVDRQVHFSLFCQELGGLREKKTLHWNESTLRFSAEVDESLPQSCADVGVQKDDENVYSAEKFKVTAPVVYFQGSHDSATLARGAFKHWQQVPQGSAQFLLYRKGGHNPNTELLIGRDTPAALRLAQQGLYLRALSGGTLSDSLLQTVNMHLPEGEGWKSFRQNSGSQSFFDELRGIEKQIALF